VKIVANEALRFHAPVDAASNIQRNIERCALLKQTPSSRELLVYWGYDEAELLTRILDPIQNLPSPMLRDYTWPGILKPFDHQKTTAAYLSLRYRAFCFNEAGTGKTSSVIWAADYLMRIGKIKRVLVICPLSIMYSAWQADIFKTSMHRSAAVAHGSRDKRAKVIGGAYEFVIINFDGVNVVQQEIVDASFDLIVVDEANAYKTTSTKRWKTLARLIKPTTRLWMLTGTPASQSPLDAFGLARLVSPGNVPRYSTAWRDKVMHQISRFKWLPKPTAKQDVYNALQPAIRFSKKECLDLPEVMYLTRDIPLTVQVANYYKKLKTQMLIEAAGEQISAVNAASKLSKLLQISGGAVYTDEHDVVEFDVSPRLHALKEALDETQNKVVIFVPYLHTLDVVCKYLNKEGYTTAVIKGDVAARERANIINTFQTMADPRVLVVQPQSASHGITLTAADTIVFWSPVMSVETYLQCIGRIDRVGQKNSMTVVHLQGSDAERSVYQMLQGKVDSHQKIVDLYKRTIEDPEGV
jgi:SNF2 family DNA or RNA helicase